MNCSPTKALMIAMVIALGTANAESRQMLGRTATGATEEFVVSNGPIGERGGTLVLPSVGEPKTFNAALANESATFRILEFLNVPMLGYDASEQHITDGLVRSYSATSDGLIWTFKLRKGIRWSDGQPFDAADVLFTFNVIFDPRLDVFTRNAFVQADGSCPKVEKVDSHTVRFKLAEPSALFLDNLSTTWLLPRHKLEEAYERGEFLRQLSVASAPGDVVGLGPFRLKETVFTEAGTDRLVLERNPYYWKKDRTGHRLPYLDQIVLRIVDDENGAFSLFLGGTTDMLVTRPADIELLEGAKADGTFILHDLGPGLNVTYLLFNRMDPTPIGSGKIAALQIAKRAWFSSEKFRQAISFAVDRERIASRVFGGKATPVYTFVTAGNTHWYDPAAVQRYPRDLRASKRLLAEIGIEDRNGDGFLEDSKGNRIEFTIRTNQNNSNRLAIVVQIVEDLAELGIIATLEPVSFVALVDTLQATHDYDAVLGGWQSGIPPDPILMKNIILSSGLLHYGRPSQSEPATPWEGRIDELMRQNERTLDLAVRQRQFSEVTRLWSENLPEIDLIAPHHVVAVRNRVGNFRPAVIGEGAWNADELFIRATDAKQRRIPGAS